LPRLWITVLLLGGGLALDRVVDRFAITRNFDDSMAYMLTAMIASAEIGPDGEVFFNRPWVTSVFLSRIAGCIGRSAAGARGFPARARCGTGR
jgi:hypothetical protein